MIQTKPSWGESPHDFCGVYGTTEQLLKKAVSEPMEGKASLRG